MKNNDVETPANISVQPTCGGVGARVGIDLLTAARG